MNYRVFTKKSPQKRRKRRNRQPFPILQKRKPIIISPEISKMVFGKILHKQIEILSKATNQASGEKLTPEEIGGILGVHPVEVREIQEILRKKESYNHEKNSKKKD